MSAVIIVNKDPYCKDLDLDAILSRTRKQASFKSRESAIMEIIENRESCMSRVEWEEFV